MDMPVKPLTVIVAEDDSDDRLLIEEAFERCGTCNLKFVEDGERLLDFLRREQQDDDPLDGEKRRVILLDLNMPVMNGLDFLKELRAMGGDKQPIVVFCTTENDMSHIQQAMTAGANEYIMKPFDTEIIESKFVQVGLI